MAELDRFDARLYHLPPQTRLVDARHGEHDVIELITVELTNTDGAKGIGYSFTGGHNGAAILKSLTDDLAPLLAGEDTDRISYLWDKMWWACHYGGRGGAAVLALSAVDIALWDLKARALNTPLWRLLGGHDPVVRCYAGGIDLHLDPPELVSTAQAAVRSGHQAYKVKIGRDRLAEDVVRVAALRSEFGDDFTLMMDANMKYRVAEAIEAARAIAPSRPLWFEEPVVPEDKSGYRRVFDLGGLPVASGENFRSLWEFREALDFGGLSYVQPDVTNCGGVSAFMKIANLADAHHLPVSSHGAHDITVHLLAACANASYLEAHGFGLDRYVTAPLQIKDGAAIASDAPGIGFDFDTDGLSKYLVGTPFIHSY
jgi:L-alanine-DL-glutamate epimerase-like enolase superfamily enzyme